MESNDSPEIPDRRETSESPASLRRLKSKQEDDEEGENNEEGERKRRIDDEERGKFC